MALKKQIRNLKKQLEENRDSDEEEEIDSDYDETDDPLQLDFLQSITKSKNFKIVSPKTIR